MKKIAILIITIFTIVCFSFKTNAQDIKKDLFEGDKGYHFVASSVGSFAINFFVFNFFSKRDIFAHRWQIEIVSGGISFLGMTGIGVLKEVLDKERGGIFDKKDLVPDMCGSFTGSVAMITIRVSLSKRQKK